MREAGAGSSGCTLPNVLDRQLVFLIGAPRSGTTWLQTMLGGHDQVCTSVEMTLFDCYLSPWFRRWNEEAAAIRDGRWHQGLPVVWSRDDFDGFIREFLAKVYGRILATKPQATHLLDKQPMYALYVEEIDRLLPSARFVHLVRDGRDVAASMIAAHKAMGFGTGTVAASAAEWKRLVEAARTAARFHDRYLEVRYEELSANTGQSLAKVFDFLKLPCDSRFIERLVSENRFEVMKEAGKTAVAGLHAPRAHFRKGRVGSWREDFTAFERFEFERQAGPLLRELGYAGELWWIEKAVDRVRVRVGMLASATGRLRRRMLGVLDR